MSLYCNPSSFPLSTVGHRRTQNVCTSPGLCIQAVENEDQGGHFRPTTGHLKERVFLLTALQR